MIIFGKQVALYALRHHPQKVRRVLIQKEGILPKQVAVKVRPITVSIDAKRAQALSRGGNHQGILLEMDPFTFSPFDAVKTGDFVVILDAITDVGNIGSIVRSAYALGVDGIVATGVKQLKVEGIMRSSSGALLDMPFALRSNILDVINELKMENFSLYGATMQGEAIEKMEFAKKRALILGSEGAGLSKRVIAKIDHAVSIGMKRSFDSLNVASAAAILIHRMG